MRVIECLKYGGVENLVLIEIEKLVFKDNEVFIKIYVILVIVSDVFICKLDEFFIIRFIL